ncbi:hypothetical protein ACFP9V_03695 [Deinococcus radiopugnans]|uniref:Cell division protein FtsL n=1 Tax=Deinococcus radiopugnans ATCC 19172 TaxID=585398 RepID=A0ABR6NSH1_9DEIO|nr:hypothetical protein [Deinococcus radiopugnans]MBB6016966.1 hypothetical protein [Deinococcus radiopugnans ATCC 19172]
MSALRPRVRSLDLTEATWRGRAVRYVLIYLALALALVGARYFTQDIRPALRAVQEREATLLTQRNDLAVQVQTLENPQRIRDWAFANGMVRFAEAPKESQAILPLPPPGLKDAAATPKPAAPGFAPPAPTSSPVQPPRPPAQPDNTVEVRTQWR